ncbi:MAG: LamG domain-containing protein [Candidatus Aureabacteria bacterium]|nr:LamG domain-containing protein [Candidatus Auribacterota bacterium]
MRAAFVVGLSAMVAGVVCGIAVAGSMDSPGVPSLGSGLYTLSQIYDFLNSGVKTTPVPGFQEPGAAPVSTMKTTKQIYDDIVAKMDQCNGTTAAEVKSGYRFFCTHAGSWGVQTGAGLMQPTPTITLTPTITPTPTISFPKTGLVSYWKLDEPSGTTVHDSHGSHNGTNHGATVYVAGKIGNAYSFDGSNDYVKSDAVIDLTGNSGKFTFNFWLKVPAFSGSGTFLELGNGQTVGGGNGVMINRNEAGKLRIYHQDPSAYWYDITTTLPTSTWVMLTIKGDGTNFTFYQDGAQIDQRAIDDYYFEAEDLYLMTHYYGSESLEWYSPGIMDEVGIWNRDLTNDEVTRLYNSGTGLAYQ